MFAAEGTPEIAVESGVIGAINNTNSGNGGLWIWLRGDSGNAYFYAHNSANLVTAGQRVGRGQIIGLVGHTGNATEGASHIHFQINRCGQLDSSEPCTIDPFTLLTSWPQELAGSGADSVGWYSPGDATFHLRGQSGSSLTPVRYGLPGDLPVTGDWNGDGRATLGVYRPSNSTFYLRDEHGKTTTIPFGIVDGGDALPLAGDWDGNGRDSVALYRRSDASFFFSDLQGRVTPSVGIGTPGEDLRPLAGDWDGDHRDSIALYRPADSTFLMLDDAQGASPVLPPTAGVVYPVHYGIAGDVPIVGDWTGAGHDSIGVYRPSDSTYHLQGFTDATPKPANAATAAQTTAPATTGVVPPKGPVRFGTPNMPFAVPLAGNWTGHDLVTLEDLVGIFGAKLNKKLLADNLPYLNAALIRSGAVTPARKAAFLATVYNESGFRADAVQAGTDPFRGRGFIQLTGAGNYGKASAALGFDLVNNPGLAANPLVSAAVAGWYWTVARNINVAADRLDMGAVNIAVGYAPSFAEDVERCLAFTHGVTWFNDGVLPAGINCARKPGSYLLAAATSSPPLAATSSSGPTVAAPTLPAPAPSSTAPPPPTTSSAPTTTPPAPPTSDGGISVPYNPPPSSNGGPVSVPYNPPPPTTPPPPPPTTAPPTTAPPAPSAPAADPTGTTPASTP